MGMFDEIRCRMSLPVDIGVDHKDHWFQTKSMECGLRKYEIRANASLWFFSNDLDKWIACDGFIGEIVFYGFASEISLEKPLASTGWLELSAYFVRGELKHLELLQFDKPEATQ